MTQQLYDSLELEGPLWHISGARGRGLVEPAALDLAVHSNSSALQRGWLAQYGLRQGRLRLCALYAWPAGERSPSIDGVRPLRPDAQQCLRALQLLERDRSEELAQLCAPLPPWAVCLGLHAWLGLSRPVRFSGHLYLLKRAAQREPLFARSPERFLPAHDRCLVFQAGRLQREASFDEPHPFHLQMRQARVRLGQVIALNSWSGALPRAEPQVDRSEALAH